jgi:hypothetical protein
LQRDLVQLVRTGVYLVAAFSAVQAALMALPSTANADSCTSPDLLETIPADKATGVPTNATLFAHYEANAQYQNEPVTMDQIHLGQAVFAGMSVPAQFDSTEGMLQVTPPDPLTPGDQYVIHWPALRGIDTATLGGTMDQHFTAGPSADMAPPSFGGISGVTWDVSRESDSCTGHIEDRYVFKLGLGAASDDGGRDLLTLLVFETDGPGVEAGSPSPVLVQRIPPDGQGATVTSTVQVGHICFAAIVRDLTMKVSTSGAPVCVDTVAPPFFYSCQTAIAASGTHRAGRNAGGGLLAGLSLVSAVALRRVSRRKERARGRSAGSVA